MVNSIPPVTANMPQSLANSMKTFALHNPQCESPKYAPLYLAALTAALVVDRNPSAANIREFNVANTKLRKELFGTETEIPSLADLLGDGE